MYLLYHETVFDGKAFGSTDGSFNGSLVLFVVLLARGGERAFLLKCGQRGKVVSALIPHIPHRGVYSLSLFHSTIPTAHTINNHIAIAIRTQ